MPRKTDQPERPETTPEAFDPVALFKPMTQNGWMSTAWFENLAEISSELTNFVAERIKEDVKTQHEMLHCKSMQELQDVQSKFLQRAIDQYQAETGKLVDMTGKMAVEMGPKRSDEPDA